MSRMASVWSVGAAGFLGAWLVSMWDDNDAVRGLQRHVQRVHDNMAALAERGRVAE